MTYKWEQLPKELQIELTLIWSKLNACVTIEYDKRLGTDVNITAPNHILKLRMLEIYSMLQDVMAKV